MEKEENPKNENGDSYPYSYNNFSFTKYLSTAHCETFLNYLTRVRMDKARELTKNTNLKIDEIGTLVGYMDPKSYTKTFQLLYNMTAKEFRKQYFFQ
jgi:two-component system, response regulator YesN